MGHKVAYGGTRYFAAAGRHCTGGVKIRVDVLQTRAGPEKVEEREILVPAWTDDWGYCDDGQTIKVSNNN